jgi:hypothetical protein
MREFGRGSHRTRGFTMNAAIDFDHECGSVAVEVYDKARYRLLSAEVPAV